MRSVLGIGIVAGLLGSTGPLVAQTYPLKATVVVSKVEIRSGPSDKFYATAELHQGDSITVIGPAKDQPGWLEIKPPWGSFTWINAKDVKQIDAYEAVVQKDCQALVGSALNTNKPDVQTKSGFLAGAIVYIVKQAVTDPGGEAYLPVQPDVREVRYIPASAITPPTAPVVATPTNWSKGSPTQTSAPPGHPGTSTEIKPASTSLSSPAATATNYPPEWSTYGILRTTTFQKDGQPMYVLVTSQGQPIMYVTSKTGTSLAGFVNRTVSLYGPRVYRSDDPYIRTPWMVASHVAVP
jgi:hypothetical protein